MSKIIGLILVSILLSANAAIAEEEREWVTIGKIDNCGEDLTSEDAIIFLHMLLNGDFEEASLIDDDSKKERSDGCLH